LRRALIALPLVALTMVLGSCGSLLYVHALWEAGNRRCGEALAEYGGWSVGFDGRTDAFVCTVHDAELRVVARKDIPVEQVMGSSGGWPLFPELIAHELEAVDEDAP